MAAPSRLAYTQAVRAPRPNSATPAATAAPRSPRRARVGFGIRSRWKAAFVVWHTACMLSMSSACLYLEPAWRDVNLRPEILNPADFVPGRTIERKLRSPVDNFLVRAFDEDDDELLFLWEDPSSTYEVLDLPDQPGTPRIQASQLRLAWDASLDGEVVSCQVFDGEDTVTVRWRIVLDGVDADFDSGADAREVEP